MPWNGLPRPNRDFRIAGDRYGDERTDLAETIECRTESDGAKNDDYHAPGRAAKGRRRRYLIGRDLARLFRRPAGMNAFRYQAIERSGKSVEGVIEADDRRSALRLLSEQGLFPSNLAA